MKFKLGVPVRQIVRPIEGVVVDAALDKATGAIQYLVESPDDDGDGSPQQRWMAESALQEIAPGEQA